MSTVIKVEHLSKEYRLGTIGHGYLFRDLQSGWARLRGKDDPNQKVFETVPTKGGNFWALNDVSFEVKQGEVLGIIGRNGAGKSTLLKILSRVTTPTKGSVKVKGRIASLLEVGTGFHPELTGRENIFLNGAILGMSKQEVRIKLDEIIAFSEVGVHIDTPVKRYSSGMYIRLAFAVAAHLESEILIVDEVLAVGDLAFQKKCLGKMKDVGKEGRTVLFVSHNLPSIRRLCNRTVILDKGKVIFDGEMSQGIETYLQSISKPPIDAEKTQQARIIDPNGVIFLSAYSTSADGIPQINFDLGDDILISIEYLVGPQVKGLIVPNIHFISEEGIYLFTSNASVSESAHAGSFKATCRIPRNLLNTGYFSIRIAISQYLDLKTIVLVDEQDYMYITVEESRETQARSDRYNFGAEYPGFFRPIFNWKVTEVRQ